jgi:hypothetical protein
MNFGAPTCAQRRRDIAEAREIVALRPNPRRETAIWDPN